LEERVATRDPSGQTIAAAFAEHLAQARDLTPHAIESAKNADHAEQAATRLINSAWREDVFGNQPLPTQHPC